MPIRMIAVDLDDTLLRSDKTLSAYTLDILRRCREKGILIVVATGRSEEACTRFLPQIAPDAMISNIGALARCDDKILFNVPLPRETADCLLKRCLACPSAHYVTADTSEGYFVNHPFDADSLTWMDYRHAILTDFKHGLKGDLYKFSVEITDRQAAEQMADGLHKVRTYAYSGEEWYSYMHAEAGKWAALEAVAERFGIDTRDIAAFGDDTIDLEMLNGCGIGVAMSNALDTVKSAANQLCESNDEDGVARWLARNIS